ncbi:glutathione S-transferase [Striga asiatica]|uniref:Glutathione S-transferase n=1 Tax=Striga asiatica TaxID=4170 RepID=A0A5A7QKI7_STRAF|nr:glutathione S-transferase [Striga asiatica]
MANDGDEVSKKLKLYSYWRSSCSCRVQIALNLKRLDYEYIAGQIVLNRWIASPESVGMSTIGKSRSNNPPRMPKLAPWPYIRGSPAKAHALTANNNKGDYPKVRSVATGSGDNRSTANIAHIEGWKTWFHAGPRAAHAESTSGLSGSGRGLTSLTEDGPRAGWKRAKRPAHLGNSLGWAIKKEGLLDAGFEQKNRDIKISNRDLKLAYRGCATTKRAGQNSTELDDKISNGYQGFVSRVDLSRKAVRNLALVRGRDHLRGRELDWPAMERFGLFWDPRGRDLSFSAAAVTKTGQLARLCLSGPFEFVSTRNSIPLFPVCSPNTSLLELMSSVGKRARRRELKRADQSPEIRTIDETPRMLRWAVVLLFHEQG